jgi:hypothetical protein
MLRDRVAQPTASRSNSKPNRDPGVRTEREIEHRNRGAEGLSRSHVAQACPCGNGIQRAGEESWPRDTLALCNNCSPPSW